MTTQGWLSLGIATGVLVALARNWGAPDAVLLAGVVVAVLARLVTPAEAFSGFANEGVLTIAAMFVVAAGMQETGAIHWIGNRIFGRARTESQALSRMAAWVTTFSAFLNNTPIVAMLLPVVTEWCRKNGVSPSRLLMPLSFLTVLGGV
ncbi:MAG: SLC13 family permease, partial [SAR202 cluster bacterium]|nr:SLC13 family permease [SAR202 cluster bacterium]